MPALVKLTGDEAEWVRRNTVEVLGTIDAPAVTLVETLTESLNHDADDQVRFTAALSLARLGAKAAGAVPALKQALKDEKSLCACQCSRCAQSHRHTGSTRHTDPLSAGRAVGVPQQRQRIRSDGRERETGKQVDNIYFPATGLPVSLVTYQLGSYSPTLISHSLVWSGRYDKISLATNLVLRKGSIIMTIVNRPRLSVSTWSLHRSLGAPLFLALNRMKMKAAYQQRRPALPYWNCRRGLPNKGSICLEICHFHFGQPRPSPFY